MRKPAIRLTTAAAALALAGTLSITLPSVAFASGPTKADIAMGKKLAFGRKKGNCLACHMIPGGTMPGNIGPPLISMKARFPNRQTLFNQIWDPMKNNPHTIMPPFGVNKILTAAEINKIVDFLYTH